MSRSPYSMRVHVTRGCAKADAIRSLSYQVPMHSLARARFDVAKFVELVNMLRDPIDIGPVLCYGTVVVSDNKSHRLVIDVPLLSHTPYDEPIYHGVGKATAPAQFPAEKDVDMDEEPG